MASSRVWCAAEGSFFGFILAELATESSYWWFLALLPHVLIVVAYGEAKASEEADRWWHHRLEHYS